MKEHKTKLKQINEQNNYINELEESIRVLGDALDEKELELQTQQNEIHELSEQLSEEKQAYSTQLTELIRSHTKELDGMVQEILTLDQENRKYMQIIEDLRTDLNGRNSKILDLQLLVRELELNQESLEKTNNERNNVEGQEDLQSDAVQKSVTAMFPPPPPPLDPTSVSATEIDERMIPTIVVSVMPPRGLPSGLLRRSVDEEFYEDEELSRMRTLTHQDARDHSSRRWAAEGKKQTSSEPYKPLNMEINGEHSSSRRYFHWDADHPSNIQNTPSSSLPATPLSSNTQVEEDDDSPCSSPSRAPNPVMFRTIRKAPISSNNNNNSNVSNTRNNITPKSYPPVRYASLIAKKTSSSTNQEDGDIDCNQILPPPVPPPFPSVLITEKKVS